MDEDCDGFDTCYADQDLADLEQAYRAQVDAGKQSYESLSRRRVKAGARNQSLSEHVADFERVQRAGNQKREAAADLAVLQARLREIEAELAYRDYTRGGMELHIRRLTTL